MLWLGVFQRSRGIAMTEMILTTLVWVGVFFAVAWVWILWVLLRAIKNPD